jgi:hypothetical protein
MSPTADNIGKILPTGRCRDIDIFFFSFPRKKMSGNDDISYLCTKVSYRRVHPLQQTTKSTTPTHNNQLEPPPPSYHWLFPPLSPWVEQRPIKSWRRRSPRPCAGRELSGLHSLSLVCLFGGAKREGSKNRGRGGCLGP